MSQSGYVNVHIDSIDAETEKAFRCTIDGETVFLPFSQIADADDYAPGDKDLSLSVTEWIAREKGLEAEE